jgi:Nif-specific regulatory protein
MQENNSFNALQSAAAKYQTLYEIGKLIASEMELAPLLKLAMDKVIEVTGAQRGFIALIDENKQLDFRVARNLQKEDIENPKFEVSRSIINEAIRSGETILSEDALADPRFSGAESVLSLHLLSVICTPIVFAGRVAGIIYVDSTDQRDLFNETVAELLAEFAQQIAIALKNSLVFADLKHSHQQQALELRGKYRFDEIIGSGKRMTELLEKVAKVADKEANVLIQGESGTGKELIARALHYNSNRFEHPFLAVHCGAISETLVESELFGHEKGAFTGAIKSKRGKFELADGGTIFLDEIAEMPPSLQVKLLRVLQDGTFTPVGCEIEKRCDVRVIAATNQNLPEMVAAGKFREDLFYRLHVIPLVIPPLRERREDIMLLVKHFLKKYCGDNRLPILTKPVQKILLTFDYPGNVRQLENLIQHAVNFCDGEKIVLEDLPEELQPAVYGHAEEAASYNDRKNAAIAKWEREELIKLLTLSRGNLREAARLAGIHYTDLSKKLRRYGIKPREYEQ